MFRLQQCGVGAAVGPQPNTTVTSQSECCAADNVAVAVPGIPGPPGGGGGGEGTDSFIFTQAVPSAVWTIAHNLGQQLVEAAAVYSLDYQQQFYNVIVEPLDPNNCKLYFADPVSGYALIER